MSSIWMTLVTATYWQGKTTGFFWQFSQTQLNHQYSFIVYPFATLPHPRRSTHSRSEMNESHSMYFFFSFRPDRPKSSLFPSSPQLRHPLTPHTHPTPTRMDHSFVLFFLTHLFLPVAASGRQKGCYT